MKKQNNKNALTVAKAYYDSWTNKEYDQADSLLDPKIQFEMPINHYDNKRDFMQAVRFTGDNATHIELLSIVGNETEAVLIYDFNFVAIGNIRIAEHFKINNEKIVFIRHIHDTFQLRNAGFGKNT